MFLPSSKSLRLVSISSILFIVQYSTPSASASAAIHIINDPPSPSTSSSVTQQQQQQQQQQQPNAHEMKLLSSSSSSSRKEYFRQREDTFNNNHHALSYFRRHRSVTTDDDGITSSISLWRRHQYRQQQLSIWDQLDNVLLRLGFTPTASSSTSIEERKDDTNNYGIMKSRNSRYHVPRGGDANKIGANAASIHTRQKQHHTRHMSMTDQQFGIISRLGFVPTSSSLLTTSGKDKIWHIARFNRGGGDGAHVVDSSAATTIILHHRQQQQHHQKNSIAFSHPFPLASIFAFLAGYSNVLCYHKFQCYATMMTGNIVTMSMLLAEQQWMNALWRCSLVICYLVGSIFARAIELQSNGSEGGTTKSQQQHHYKMIALIVVAIFAIAEKILSSSWGEESSRHHIFTVPILAIGYGIVHTSANRACNATMTQLLTGHITKLGISFSNYIIMMMHGNVVAGGSSKPSWSGKKEVTMSCGILASFVFGGLVGSKLLGTAVLLGATGFPHFALLGLIYALVFAFC